VLCQLSYSHRNLSIIAMEVQREIGEAGGIWCSMIRAISFALPERRLRSG
jgi:hypothetical protein